MGGGGEWVGSRRWVISSAVSLVSDRKTNSIQRIDRDSCWQQSSTTHILINVIQWLHKLCSAPSWYDRVGKNHL